MIRCVRPRSSRSHSSHVISRDQVVRKDALGALGLAIDGERDPLMEEGLIGGGLTLPHLLEIEHLEAFEGARTSHERFPRRRTSRHIRARGRNSGTVAGPPARPAPLTHLLKPRRVYYAVGGSMTRHIAPACVVATLILGAPIALNQPAAAGRAMSNAATAFLKDLNAEQRSKATFKFEDDSLRSSASLPARAPGCRSRK